MRVTGCCGLTWGSGSYRPNLISQVVLLAGWVLSAWGFIRACTVEAGSCFPVLAGPAQPTWLGSPAAATSLGLLAGGS